ncbi:MAG: DUF2262 domain-containing protein, partial [Sandaracinaceae bacterium]|nr:DUF2262 domain-containing protein [Sandaracinaceae bacterium]
TLPPDADDPEPALAALPRAGSLVEVEVEAPERLAALGRPRGDTKRVLARWSQAQDDELAAFARSVAPPEHLDDPELGRLSFDPRLRWYTQRREGGLCVQVWPADAREPDAVLSRARPVVRFVEAQRESLRCAVADRMWALWDGDWRQPEEEHIDRAAFEQCLTLDAVTVDADGDEGSFTLFFVDGGLFGGHGIEVFVRDWKVQDASLCG